MVSIVRIFVQFNIHYIFPIVFPIPFNIEWRFVTIPSSSMKTIEMNTYIVLCVEALRYCVQIQHSYRNIRALFQLIFNLIIIYTLLAAFSPLLRRYYGCHTSI